MFRGKSLESIAKADLESLITDQESEGQRLEYKSQMYANHQKIEMLKDITAMANAEGGYLVIGIEDDGNGKPKSLVGIDNGEKVRDSIVQSSNSSIEDQILGLNIRVVEIGNDRSVVIISIPKSTRKPHMVTLDNHNRFYIRRDRSNLLMNLNEIRDAVLTIECTAPPKSAQV